jgi:hypothetical protein
VEATEPNEPKTFDQLAEGLLAPAEAEAPNPEPEMEEAEDAPDDDQTEAADADEELGDDADDADGEETASEDDETGEEDASSEEPAQRYTVKVDGEEVQVTLDELQRSYSGQSHIQKGMRAAAEARKSVEAMQQQITQERQQLATLIQTIQQTGLQEPKEPDPALMDKDPLAYMKQDAKYKQELKEYTAKRAAVQQQYQQHTQAEQQRLQQFRAEQEQALIQSIPELADPVKAAPVKQAIVRAGTQYGFTEDELGGIVDARQVRVLNDARKWQELQAQKAAAQEKVKTARPVVKPGVKKVPSSRSKLQEQRKRLKQTGSIDDAVNLLLAPE